MTTLLSELNVYRLTDTVRKQLTEALAQQGLRAEPSIFTAHRSARISFVLNTVQCEPEQSSLTAGGTAVGITYWTLEQEGWTQTPHLDGPRRLLLVDVDLAQVHEPAVLFNPIPARLNGLDQSALSDVMTADHRASFKRATSAASTRRASLFVVNTEEVFPPVDETSVSLSLGLVEFAVGQDWIFIARHPPLMYVNGAPKEDDVRVAVQSAPAYMASLQDCGLSSAESADTAALAIITQAVDSFGTARTELASYIDTWRTEFVNELGDRRLLINLQATLPLIVDALEPLRRPTVVRWLDAEPRDRARELNEHVDRHLDALHNLQTTTADALAQADQHQNEMYQGSLATLAAVFLAPALVASIFGASDALTRSPFNLIWLFVAMLLAGLVTNVLLRRRRHYPRRP